MINRFLRVKIFAFVLATIFKQLKGKSLFIE